MSGPQSTNNNELSFSLVSVGGVVRVSIFQCSTLLLLIRILFPIVSGSEYLAFISHLYWLSWVLSVSSIHIESRGVECGIVVVDVIILLFHFICKLYRYPSWLKSSGQPRLV